MWLWIYLWVGFLWISTGVLLPEPFRWLYFKDGEPDLLFKFVAIVCLSLIWPLVVMKMLKALAQGRKYFNPFY